MSILDIGSGKSQTFKNIAYGNSPDIFEYVSIDKEFDDNSQLFKDDMWKRLKRTHIRADVFEWEEPKFTGVEKHLM